MPPAPAPSPAPASAPDLVGNLRKLLIELIRLSRTVGKNCPYAPPPPPAVPFDAADVGDDPRRAEYLAAMRGLFGPEAGPPSDDKKIRIAAEKTRRRLRQENGDKKKSETTPLPGGGESRGRRETGQGGGVREEKGGGDRDDEGAACEGVADGGTPLQRNDHAKRWETPEEARERLEFRLRMATRRLDVACAAAAAVAVAMRAPGPGIRRVVESWATAAGKVARSAGVAALHGKPLVPEEAEAGGRPGVTW